MKMAQVFTCEVCGTEWRDQKWAERCEATALPPCPVKVGDQVKVYERYGDPEDDEVIGVCIGPSFIVHHVAGRETQYTIDAVDIPFHTWLIRVKKHHQMSKDSDSYTDEVSVENIMVDGKWLKERAA